MSVVVGPTDSCNHSSQTKPCDGVLDQIRPPRADKSLALAVPAVVVCGLRVTAQRRVDRSAPRVLVVAGGKGIDEHCHLGD